MLAEARRTLPAGWSSCRGRRSRFRSTTPPSTGSRSPTSFATSTIQPRRCTSSRGSSQPGGTIAMPRVRRAGEPSRACRVGRVRRCRPARVAGRADLARAGRRSGGSSARASSRFWAARTRSKRQLAAVAKRRGSRTSASDAHVSAAVSSSGVAGREANGRRSTPSAGGRLAGLRHAAARPVHALASELRRDRRRPGAGSGCPAASSSRSSRSSSRSASARTRWTSSRGGRSRRTFPRRSSGASRRHRSPARSRSASSRRSRGLRGCSPSLPSAASSSSRTTWSSSAGCFHGDAWFAVGWGALPRARGVPGRGRAALLGAATAPAFAAFLSYAQRCLSTPVRRLRRGASRLGPRARRLARASDHREVLRASELALRAMTVATIAISVALVLTRV